MVALQSKSLMTAARLALLILLVTVLLSFVPSFTRAQSDAPSPDSPEPVVAQPPANTNGTVTSPPPANLPGSTPTRVAPATSTPLPNPIFSTSDACVACQKEYYTIQNCSSHMPPPNVNLTMIVQLLPFYGCLCQNNKVEIDALQQCSTCFRSTGQLAYLNTHFYNVTNQEAKAYRKVCDETANGTRVPSSGAAGNVLHDWLARSGTWITLAGAAFVLLPLGGF
ncbi:hypothetical protein BGZ99_001485 [Dissophora globulifera]|uniref:Transmembrane protein n=1 Tax=Dissophora globulifera TaxID=979702 RepID=A0A9P6QYP1_9FUNG|nr:hypothetical protein BGZ99_001485 [Dissophora globulifera]